MADDQASQLIVTHGRNKAREILDRMFEHRIDPRTLKITETQPRAKGGQGTVTPGTIFRSEEVVAWRPEHLLNRLVERKLAIKKLEWNRENPEASAKFFKSFVNELSIMVELSHPNIVEFIGFVEDAQKGDAWIIIPWEENRNVKEFLESGEWDIPERISLVQDIANGVEYLHTRQPPICHGDLKSLNILVNCSYHADITDFGSARIQQNVDATMEDCVSASEVSHQAAADGIAQGATSPNIKLNRSTMELTLTGPGFSLRWTAPEVLNNGVQALPSDMWAIGWICWEIFTGKMPFEGLNLQGVIISRVITGKLPSIREEAELSHILALCSLMTDFWFPNPVRRIDASTFRRKVQFLPSTLPSGRTSGVVKVRSAALLEELGTMCALQDNKVEAESYYQSSLDVATRTKDDRAKANALCNVGLTYCHTPSRYQEAEKASMESYEIHSRIGNELGMANALHSLGNIYHAQRRNREAEKAFVEAQEIHSRVGESLGAAIAFIGLGFTYLSQLRNSEAEKAFMKAQTIGSRIGSDFGVATALEGLGSIYRVQGCYPEAEKAFVQVHEIYSRIGHNRGTANALYGLGESYRLQSRNLEAERALKEAHDIHSRIGNNHGAANALHALGETYRAQSKNLEAEKAFKEAHEIHSRIGNDLGAANALDSLEELYRAQPRNQ